MSERIGHWLFGCNEHFSAAYQFGVKEYWCDVCGKTQRTMWP